MSRHLIYRSAKARQFLCVCLARDERHALKIARRMFQLDRTAYAVAERAQSLLERQP